jgi:hypothetical protein
MRKIWPVVCVGLASVINYGCASFEDSLRSSKDIIDEQFYENGLYHEDPFEGQRRWEWKERTKDIPELTDADYGRFWKVLSDMDIDLDSLGEREYDEDRIFRKLNRGSKGESIVSNLEDAADDWKGKDKIYKDDHGREVRARPRSFGLDEWGFDFKGFLEQKVKVLFETDGTTDVRYELPF